MATNATPLPNGFPPPPLKWAGGKRWQLPVLRPLWESSGALRLVEPFCGGLSVALGLAPDQAHLNDINPHVINFYRHLQQGFRLKSKLRNDEDYFYRARTKFNRLLAAGQAESIDSAELFYYLNRTCYNGLCRFNASGSFNTPFGRYARIEYARDWSAYERALNGWVFTSIDFEGLRPEPTDFIYADPPYDVPFTSYSKEGFSWSDQVRLVDWLAVHSGPVVLVNQATARILELYERRGFRVTLLDAPRRISCTGDRESAREVLATRNLPFPARA